MWEYKKVIADDSADYAKDWAKVEELLKEGFEIFQITSATAGADTKWIRHFFWLRRRRDG